MKTKFFKPMFLAVFIAILAASPFALASPNRNFSTHLVGDQQNPPVQTLAQGQAIFTLSKDGLTLHYKIIAANIENIMQAHIHLGPTGVNGPIVLWLYQNPMGEIRGQFNH